LIISFLLQYRVTADQSVASQILVWQKVSDRNLQTEREEGTVHNSPQ